MKTSDSRSVLVVSDVHLSREPSRGAAALTDLLREHADHELVVAGDFFDLAFDPPHKHPAESISEILRAHRALVEVLAERLERGVPVTLLAGNHDAAVADPATRDRLLAALGLAPEAPLVTYPWFIRRSGVHIEHGHFYDPDNAPTHPLSPWSYHTEPLGIAMTRRFVAPNGAMMFAGAYEVTPLAGLWQVFTEYRLRAPLVIANYFTTAGGLCVRARTARGRLARELERGAEQLASYAERLGVALDTLEGLLGAGARPTHHRFRDTFMRLYLDRILATLGSVGGLVASGLGYAPGLLLAGLGAAYLAVSVKSQGSRYQHLPGVRLRLAAERVMLTTGVHSVIFGHTHVEDAGGGYLNLGSFSFAREHGRPYAVIHPDGQVLRRHFAR